MKLTEAMKTLKSMGTAQNRKVYARHGVGENMFGVSFADLGKLKRQIKQDQRLAAGLWATGNYDAMNLATMIADAHSFTSKQIDEWLVGAVENRVVGLFVRHIASRTSHAPKKADKWMKSKKEYVGKAGYNMLTHLAMDGRVDDDYMVERIEHIEANIHSAKNRTREAMNQALIAIGGRGGALAKKAVAAAKRIGPVEVDHGETGCKTPDAASYIKKMLDHSKKKAAKKKTATAKRKVAKKTSRARA